MGYGADEEVEGNEYEWQIIILLNDGGGGGEGVNGDIGDESSQQIDKEYDESIRVLFVLFFFHLM